MAIKHLYLTEAELTAAVTWLRAQSGGVTVQDYAAVNGVHAHRARAVLHAVCLPPTWERMSNGCGKRARYVLHPDPTSRIRLQLAVQDRRRATRIRRTRVPDTLPTYATGDPTHFDVDHLGRVIYRGPVGRAMHPKWSFVEEVEADRWANS